MPVQLYVNRAPGKGLDPLVKAYLQLALSPQGQAILDAQQDSEKGICRSAGRICWPSAGNWTPCKVSLTARLGTGQGGRYNAAMFIRQGRAVIVLWIACFAILIAALAPTLRAFTVASGQAVPSFEICSVAGGMNMLPVKLSTEAPDPAQGAMRMDCPLQHARGHLDILPRRSCWRPAKSSRACCPCCSTSPPRPVCLDTRPAPRPAPLSDLSIPELPCAACFACGRPFVLPIQNLKAAP
jgi:hypothetical protein